MEALLWLVRSPAKLLLLLCLSLGLALAYAVQETRRLQALLAARPKVEYVERVRINERVVEVRTPDGTVRVETTRESEAGKESREEPVSTEQPKHRFVGVGYGLQGYREAFIGLEVGRLQLSTGVYSVLGTLGAKIQLAWKF